MKEHMKMISGVYFIIVSLGLFLWIHFFSGDILVKHIIPVALGLIVLWFILIYAIMKRDEKQRNRKEEDKQ
ncbi:hypothetical protein SDC9_95935 [bioreactor metagenome]|jgi:apolipoprotein N-acyltransferase|uniref:Uncharacterized protein n=1 Tax=bioreactor metagenome TaxID=1076179 RepID=A0A645A807_9ZZZZ|nr:hypothetical protein [Anaerotignum propionicum]MEA5056448.1 hypothetical protein [Anaerotignum propionicum]